ncbi:hypothetical protein PVAG01_02733 [Phlyctema vagabunda]|uniref:Uncharacterized protein n=1 Tax=Phlyctema vagabunda TaxID=108571 RepID=A0ABR4PRH2_9HELO
MDLFLNYSSVDENTGLCFENMPLDDNMFFDPTAPEAFSTPKNTSLPPASTEDLPAAELPGFPDPSTSIFNNTDTSGFQGLADMTESQDLPGSNPDLLDGITFDEPLQPVETAESQNLPDPNTAMFDGLDFSESQAPVDPNIMALGGVQPQRAPLPPPAFTPSRALPQRAPQRSQSRLQAQPDRHTQTIALTQYQALQKAFNEQSLEIKTLQKKLERAPHLKRVRELKREVAGLLDMLQVDRAKDARRHYENDLDDTDMEDVSINYRTKRRYEDAFDAAEMEGMGADAKRRKTLARRPLEAPLRPRTGTSRNRRPNNIASFDSLHFYEPLQNPPAPWGSINPSTGKPVFQYTAEGELEPILKLTVNQMIEYIAGHPLHRRDPATGEINGQDSGLSLRIQITPADSLRRYPQRQSDKCRFQDCPIRKNSILKGQYRVCFDELSSRNELLDPFHNAGYVHLFCMEKFLNFPLVCSSYNVMAENRKLPEGKNRMALGRDSDEMLRVTARFFRNVQPWPTEGKPKNWYQSSLCLALTKEQIKHEPSKRREVREQRGGNHVGSHMNDLDVLAYNREMELMEKKHANSKKRKGKQPAGDEDESEDESEGDYEDEDEDDLDWTPHSRKRTRR